MYDTCAPLRQFGQPAAPIARRPGTLRHRLTAILPLSKVLATDATGAGQFTNALDFPVLHQLNGCVRPTQVLMRQHVNEHSSIVYIRLSGTCRAIKGARLASASPSHELWHEAPAANRRRTDRWWHTLPRVGTEATMRRRHHRRDSDRA